MFWYLNLHGIMVCGLVKRARGIGFNSRLRLKLLSWIIFITIILMVLTLSLICFIALWTFGETTSHSFLLLYIEGIWPVPLTQNWVCSLLSCFICIFIILNCILESRPYDRELVDLIKKFDTTERNASIHYPVLLSSAIQLQKSSWLVWLQI